MAKLLNRSRVRDTYLILGVCLVSTIFTWPVLGFDSVLTETLDMLGLLLVAACVIGRICSTMFLGGHKNQTLITIGPFAACRNPLYFCTLIGVTGIAMMSNRLTLIVIIPGLLALVFLALIRREEVFLLQLFGAAYIRYREATPRLWPRLERFGTPDTLVINPKLLMNAAMDGMLWFLALPIFEIVEGGQRAGTIQVWFRLL